jgi:hypothetical protein
MLVLNYCLSHMLWSKSFVNFVCHVLELSSFKDIYYHVHGSKRHLILFLHVICWNHTLE